MLNDYGMNTGNRKNIKSPQSSTQGLKNIDEVQHLKRKYE